MTIEKLNAKNRALLRKLSKLLATADYTTQDLLRGMRDQYEGVDDTPAVRVGDRKALTEIAKLDARVDWVNDAQNILLRLRETLADSFTGQGWA